MKFTGTARKVGDHIDTDAIIPARFLVTVDPKILGAQCLSGLEPDWVCQVKNGDILVAGRNFGCGSSREHAPIAIIGAGLRAVIAHSFARIFYRNAFNTGLLLLEVGEEAYSIQHGDTLEIDPSAGRIRIVESGRETVCPPLPEHMAGILAAGGLVGYVGQRLKTGNNA
ncbi:MAG: 3-isopropylmalate dehydratase small subunit [Candidatus Desulfovibrio kirbyi]|jgi:3-isopropylmalate/(R)-2-methylmalate dehydratase small subunit|uniref:3-isopropylmalate dehydratase small subunit n=1 Tax=Candidatus Desulfovibrio kirbyi TaxID=2696086 RepID=A0A6L2R489_9BACT|nr:3-isopropylmalate dehydratase small subunit [Desulfovibrio sp.]GFH62401.1 MAG: 3-isopropylmalate dehydratase small subunit [Candidatus Desulfovibrio kirbyi]